MLSVLLSSVLEGNAEIASLHDDTVDIVKARSAEGLDIVLSALATVAASSSALEERIVCSTDLYPGFKGFNTDMRL